MPPSIKATSTSSGSTTVIICFKPLVPFEEALEYRYKTELENVKAELEEMKAVLRKLSEAELNKEALKKLGTK